MKLDRVDPPREFEVGGRGTKLRQVADAWLEPDEVITFRTESGEPTELDVSRKDWGYYATSSLNGRLAANGLRPVLAISGFGVEPGSEKMFVLLCEHGREEAFRRYVDEEGMEIVAWLDTDARVAEAARLLEGSTILAGEEDTQ